MRDVLKVCATPTLVFVPAKFRLLADVPRMPMTAVVSGVLGGFAPLIAYSVDTTRSWIRPLMEELNVQLPRVLSRRSHVIPGVVANWTPSLVKMVVNSSKAVAVAYVPLGSRARCARLA